MADENRSGATSSQIDDPMPSFPLPIYLDKTSFFNIQYEGAPLWRNSSNDTCQVQEYYEVEVYADETDDVGNIKKIDDILNTPTYKCHLCNIDVPKTYIKEHIQSAKHENCLEITNIALERTNLYMKTKTEQSLKVEVKGTYFCEPCAVIVRNVDKETHVLTKGHINSVEHDELLLKLVDIYKNPAKDVDEIVDKLAQVNIPEQPKTHSIQSDATNVSDIETNEQYKTLNDDSKTKDTVTPTVAAKTNCKTEAKHEATEKVFENTAIKKKKQQNKAKKQKAKIQPENKTKIELKATVNDKTTKGTEKSLITKENKLSDKAGTSTDNVKCKDNKAYNSKLKSYLEINIRTAVSKNIMVEIKALNGDTVKIPLINFHGFYITENDVVSDASASYIKFVIYVVNFESTFCFK